MFASPLRATDATALPASAACFDDWTVTADPASGDRFAVTLMGDRAHVTATEDAVGLALRRPFSGPVASRGATLRISLRIPCDDARALKASLVNLSISGSIGGRRRTLLSLHASAFEAIRDDVLVVTFETTWASRATACFLELRFRRQKIDLRIGAIASALRVLPRNRGSGGGRPMREVSRFSRDRHGADARTGDVWTLKVPNGAGRAAVAHQGEDGLAVDFAGSEKPFGLEARLPLPDASLGKMLRIDLRLRCNDAHACQELLSQVAIGVSADGGAPRSQFRLSPNITYAEGASELRLVTEAACLGDKTHCHIELTFHGDEGHILLEEVEVVLVRLKNRTDDKGRAASEAAPERRTIDPRIAVVGWQLADNAVGRAFLLADMLRTRYPTEIAGPLFGPAGAGVWEPLGTADIPMRAFPGRSMRAFLADAMAFAADVACDVAYASKPRLPALLLALLIHHRSGCGLVLDIDDHELSFFPGTKAVGIDEAVAIVEARRDLDGPDAPGTEDDADLSSGELETATAALSDEDRPDGRLWTSVAETLVETFADRTVSNPALRERFGGIVVRHARDEAVFRPDPALRARIRQEFGIDEDDRCILFMGTPRRHKGLERVAAALHRVDDPRLRLVVVGTIADRGMQRDLLAFNRARISLFANQPWQRLPELSQLADGVCLLQDPQSPIAHYQIPAKLSDALALGVPVATTRVAPLADVPAPSVVTYVDDDAALDAWLRGVADGPQDAAGAQRRVAWFEEELSYRVNRARMELTIDHALARPREWRREWTDLFAALNRCYGASLPETPPDWIEAGAATPVRSPAVHTSSALDLVCFWKQNDTGVYGRRHDMLMKYLRESERVRSITVFDAPIRAAALQKAAQRGQTAALDQAKLTTDATLRRFLELDDERDVRRRVFVHADKPGQTLYGQALDVLEGYADFVSRHLPPRAAGRRRLAWAWPVAPHFAEIAGTVGFDGVVADLVDDERSMTRDADRRQVLEGEYERTLACADIVFANCETLRERFPAYRDVIRVVPNGCEIGSGAIGGAPSDIARLPGPIIGYVGNLRSRLDVPLIEDLARLHPEWSIVLVGSAHGSPEVLRLQGQPNVHFTGPRPYEEALRYIRRFDVAIMPHLRNDLTDSMNPLKLYVYVALGKRVVSTSVGNIQELRDHVDVAADSPDFLAKVELAVARARFEGADRPLSRETLWAFSWQRRVATMLAAIA
jgi:glycosyltransferase involved in cell wall biosynthesis